MERLVAVVAVPERLPLNTPLVITFPDKRIFPNTSRDSVGIVEPIPTLPPLDTYNVLSILAEPDNPEPNDVNLYPVSPVFTPIPKLPVG